MLQLKRAVRLGDLASSPKQALLTAARLRADAVELDARTMFRPSELSQTAIRHLRKTMEDHCLRVAGVAYPTQRGYGAPERLDARLEGTRAAMRLAWQLGATCVVNALGDIPDPDEDPTTWQTLLESLTELARFGDREGAHLAGLTGATPLERVRALREALPEGTLQLAADPGQLVIDRFAPAAYVETFRTEIRYAYASDGIRDAAEGRGRRVPLGQGLVDWPAYLAALEESGFQGCLVVRTCGAHDPITEADDALAYLETLF